MVSPGGVRLICVPSEYDYTDEPRMRAFIEEQVRGLALV